MSARKRSQEIRKAKSQKIQEEVHRVLYCDTEWNEAEIYGRRFRRIVERANLGITTIDKIHSSAIKEFRRRVERKLKGREPLDKSLLFYRILEALNTTSLSCEEIFSILGDFSEKCINNNLIYLEQSRLIIKEGCRYRLSSTSKKLLNKLNV